MIALREVASADLLVRDRVYNLFRNNQRSKLICAVPEEYPVPSFISGEAWSFEGVLHAQDRAPSGYNDKAARAGVRYNGFYLFQAATREVLGTRSALQHSEEAA